MIAGSCAPESLSDFFNIERYFNCLLNKKETEPQKVSDTVAVNHNGSKKTSPPTIEEVSNAYWNYWTQKARVDFFAIFGIELEIITYLKPYKEDLDALAQKLGIKGKENLKRIYRILGYCSKRIQDENHYFVHLVMAIMLAESNWDDKVVSNAGAIGIMQIMPENAVEMMLHMDLDILFNLGITPALVPTDELDPKNKLFYQLIHIKDLDRQSRCVRSDDPSYKQKLKDLRNEYNEAFKEAMKTVKDSKILENPTINMSIGIYYIAYLLEMFKLQKGIAKITDNTLKLAIVAYNAGHGRAKRALAEFKDYRKAVCTTIKRKGRGKSIKQCSLRQYGSFLDFLPDEAQKYMPKVLRYFELIRKNPEEFKKLIR